MFPGSQTGPKRLAAAQVMFIDGLIRCAFGAGIIAWMPVIAPHALGATNPADLSREVQSVLAGKCFPCHGPDTAARKAGMRLDFPGSVPVNAKGQPVIVPGNAESSRLVSRVLSTDPDKMMPPPDSGRSLNQAEKQLLVDWVNAGAPRQPHWAFVPPQPAPIPTTRNTEWPLSGIDRFLLAKMESEGVTPSADADRRTWLRRASIDLTGLPPTAEEVAAFLVDGRPNAYELQLERLISSPQFGERLALLWLDLVRYADTTGYHGDVERPVWPYRDYVVASFNRNTSFAEFTRAQLAGDLMPSSNLVTRIASTYNMLIKSTEESGANEQEYLLRYAADRVRNVASVWLGLSLGCAECHDHKSDPLSIRDFYALSAFFADIDEPGVGKPIAFRVPSHDEEMALDQLHEEIREHMKFEVETYSKHKANFTAWIAKLREFLAKGTLRWNPVEVVNARTSTDQEIELLPDGTLNVTSPPVSTDYEIRIRTALPEVRSVRLQLIRPAERNAAGAIGNGGTGFRISEVELYRETSGQPAERVPFDSVAAAQHVSGGETENLIDGVSETAWMTGDRINKVTWATFAIPNPLAMTTNDTLRIVIRNPPGTTTEQPRQFRINLSPLAANFPEDQLLSDHLLSALKIPERDWSEKTVSEFAAIHAEDLSELRAQIPKILALRKRQQQLSELIPECVITQRRATPRETRVLPRGNWMDTSGDVVAPAIPVVFGTLVREGSSRLDREDLAEWLVSRQNPLTARVFVNRLWKHFFGTALVQTVNDFGLGGEAPSHPELLDTLAVAFMENGWNVKQIVYLITASRAYRQASAGRPELERLDPDNRLFARQGHWRIEAELIRDLTLYSAGILVTNLSGKPFFPDQPSGHWDMLDFPLRIYSTSQGFDQYRRGLYVFRQRTFPHPALTLFDAPSREECSAERMFSNTPLQALLMLNSPSHIEAALMLACRALEHSGASEEATIHRMMQFTLQRTATAEELSELKQLYQRQLARNRLPDAQADQLVGMSQFEPLNTFPPPPELAAWTAVARAILNLHETITRY